jgi:hypothetical protein
MSVLRCTRNGCENIMCDRYSYNYGYICNECFEELKLSKMSIDHFMLSVKRGVGRFIKDQYSEYLENEFKLTGDE